MAHRSSRYQPERDDPHISRDAYPDPYGGANGAGYEYVGTEEGSDVEEPSSARQRSPDRRQRRPRRASTLPPEASDTLDPPRARRHRSPTGRSKHSDSPPRRRQSRRDVSPPKRVSKTEAAAVAAAAGAGAGVGAGGKFKNKYGQWVNGPAAKNMKVYGKKGLHTMGDLVEAYAAAQAGGAAAAGMERPSGRARSRPYYDDYDDPYDRPPRRSRHRYSPSPSPSPPRRGAYKRSERNRPGMNGRHKSYSLSPAPRGRGKGYDSGEDRRHSRRSRRHSPSPSPSPSPPRRRGRARSHSHGRDSVAPSTRSKSSQAKPNHPHMQHYKDEMKSPNSDVAHRWQFAARAALEAGGMTAFRLRKEPGSWTGPKGAKVVTAALGAAAIDSFIDKDPRRKKEGGMKGMAQKVVGGMVASKLMGLPASSTHKGEPRW